MSDRPSKETLVVVACIGVVVVFIGFMGGIQAFHADSVWSLLCAAWTVTFGTWIVSHAANDLRKDRYE